MLKFDKSACGCNLKTGSKIVGYLNVIFYGLALIGSIIAINGLDKASKGTYSDDQIHAAKIASWILIVTCVICVIASVLMLYGVYTERPSYILPWLVIKVIATIISIAVAIVNLTSGGTFGSLIVNIIIEMISIYLILIVYNFHRQLNEQSSNYA